MGPPSDKITGNPIFRMAWITGGAVDLTRKAASAGCSDTIDVEFLGIIFGTERKRLIDSSMANYSDVLFGDGHASKHESRIGEMKCELSFPISLRNMLSRFKLYPFGGVFCVSLRRSGERRKHIVKELRKNNIRNYEFVDAIDKGDQIVEDAYQNGAVRLFPPCFRCGKNDCQCDNNVLIPTQVATFYSHMKVWELIANKKSGIYLIIEDDIKFNWYYKLVKYYVFINLTRYSKNNERDPLLIRLGWAYDSEHKLQGIKFIRGLLKMSNPMYAINPAMADILLKEFKNITTTVDIFVHDNVGLKYENYTLIPPLAHELSFSHGNVESLIRPRKKRIDELKKTSHKNDGVIKKELDEYDKHIDRAVFKRLLVIGYPCTGLRYMSELLGAYGLDIGYEAMGRDGIASWRFTVYDLHNPYYSDKYAKSRYFSAFEHTLLVTMDPKSVIPRIVAENKEATESCSFRARHIKSKFGVDLYDVGNDTERAIESYYFWIKLGLLNEPDFVIRVEEDEEKLTQYLCETFNEAGSKAGEQINSNLEKAKQFGDNEKYTMSDIEWLELSENRKSMLNELCEMLNYQPIYNRRLTEVIR